MRSIDTQTQIKFGGIITLCVGAAFFSTRILYQLLNTSYNFTLGAILTTAISFYLWGIIAYRISLAITPVPQGNVAPNSPEERTANLYVLFYIILWAPLMSSNILPAPLYHLLAQALGAKMGSNSYNNGALLDPPLTTIGQNTVIDYDAVVFAHEIEGDHLAFNPVIIGDNVMIGTKAVIMPGVQIDDRATIYAGSVVTKGTHIKSGEVWGGIPARLLTPAPIAA